MRYWHLPGLDKVFFFLAARSKVKISCQNNLEFSRLCLVFFGLIYATHSEITCQKWYQTDILSTNKQVMRQDIGNVKYETHYLIKIAPMN